MWHRILDGAVLGILGIWILRIWLDLGTFRDGGFGIYQKHRSSHGLLQLVVSSKSLLRYKSSNRGYLSLLALHQSIDQQLLEGG
jgi:hypothetical protein